MRYQPRFPGVVPHTGVGWARATHPSAADPRRSVGPRDLHALGTPPALFLSQDQTLWHVVARSRALCASPPAPHGTRRDTTVHTPGSRPGAHAPRSTCQGATPGGHETPLLTSGGALSRCPVGLAGAALVRASPVTDLPLRARPRPAIRPADHSSMLPHPAVIVNPPGPRRPRPRRAARPVARDAVPRDRQD